MSDQLEQIISTLRKGQQLQSAAWQEVQACARKYAQMKLHGSYLNGSGDCVNVGHRDRESYTSSFQAELLEAASRAFLEDALMGATAGRALSRPA